MGTIVYLPTGNLSVGELARQLQPFVLERPLTRQDVLWLLDQFAGKEQEPNYPSDWLFEKVDGRKRYQLIQDRIRVLRVRDEKAVHNYEQILKSRLLTLRSGSPFC